LEIKAGHGDMRITGANIPGCSVQINFQNRFR